MLPPAEKRATSTPARFASDSSSMVYDSPSNSMDLPADLRWQQYRLTTIRDDHWPYQVVGSRLYTWPQFNPVVDSLFYLCLTLYLPNIWLSMWPQIWLKSDSVSDPCCIWPSISPFTWKHGLLYTLPYTWLRSSLCTGPCIGPCIVHPNDCTWKAILDRTLHPYTSKRHWKPSAKPEVYLLVNRRVSFTS